MAQANPQRRAVKSSKRTLDILEHLAAAATRRTLGELARELGIPKSSLHAILRTMQEKGWVQVDTTGTRFGLGVRALLVGTSYLEANDVVSFTADVLNQLAEQTGETVHLGQLDGADVVYLAKRESKHELRLFSRVGRRLPAHATALGKAILSEQDQRYLRTHLPDPLPALTPLTIVDHSQLWKHLELIRERGYATDDQESTMGIRCIAVPLHIDGQVRHALSCSAPISRLTPDIEKDIISALSAARTRIELQFGHVSRPTEEPSRGRSPGVAEQEPSRHTRGSSDRPSGA